MDWSTHALAFAQAQRKKSLEELKEFIRFASISAQPAYAGVTAKCAAWLASHLRSVGLEHAQVVPTSRHPIVCASWRHARGAPTVLIYGHYDVQPAEPLGEWCSPPFDPDVRGDNIYGRGASDNKGQMFVHVKAMSSS